MTGRATGRIDVSGRIDLDPLLDTCGHLGDAVYDWWNGSPPPLLYRSRTTPGVGRNIAFTHTARWSVIADGRSAKNDGWSPPIPAI